MNDNQNIETTYTTSADVRSGNEVTYTTARVDQDCRCCRSGSDDTTTNMLKVVWGNDVNISIQLSKKVGDEYESYDLSDGEDYELYIVDKYGDRVEFPVFIASNRIKTILDSYQLESNVPYSIEVIWKEGPYDKRVFGKDMFMYVNSSIDATPSDTSITPQTDYEYNIVMEGDICYISIGQIPNVDISNYVTQGELTTSLDALWQDCNDTFVDQEELADAISDIDLSYYVTQSDLDSMSYATQAYVTNAIANIDIPDPDLSSYVTYTFLSSQSYVTNDDLSAASYVTQTDLSSNAYVTQTDLSNNSYATESYVSYAIAGVTIDETNLVHKTGDESIAGTKTFANRVLVQQGMSMSGDLLVNSSQSLLSRNVLESAPVSVQTGRISTNQLATSDIIAPSSDYTVSLSGFSGTKDTIVFSRDVASSPSIVTLQQMAKIDSNGIYEGTTLLENKYLQIANMPSIPAYTSDLVNNSGFLTQSDIDNMSYVTYNEVEKILEDSSYATQSYVTEAISQIPQPDLSSYVKYTELDAMGYVTSSELDTTLANASYVSQSSLDAMSYVTQTQLNNAAYITLNDIPPIPSNVVVSDDGNEIVCLTQSQYDTLEQSQQLDPDVFYYITDTTSNYVSQTQLNNAAYITQSALDSMGYITLNDIPTIPTVNDGTLTIQKNSTTIGTFTANQSTSSTINISVPTDTSELTNNGGFLTQQNIDQMGYLTQQNIDQMGYVSTQDVDTILTNASYVTYTYLYSYVGDAVSHVSPSIDLSSYVTYLDWDNSNEAIAQELTDNRLAHIDINNQFSYYYTKTESDSRYATQSWTNNKFVTNTENEQQNEAIAYAISYLNDNIGQGGGNTPDLSAYVTKTELSQMSYIDQAKLSSNSYVVSPYVTYIWSGSQSDYNQLTPDSNTLYVII